MPVLAIFLVLLFPLAPFAFVILITRELILDFGFRVRFLGINIPKYDHTAEETVPLSPEMREKFLPYCRRTGQNVDDFRMLK